MNKTVKYQMQAFFTNGKENDPFPVKSVKEFDRIRFGVWWVGVGARLLKKEIITSVAQEYPAEIPRSY